jgi:hypothetical protein
MTMAEFPAIFAYLRAAFAAYEPQGVLLHDDAHRYTLGTHEVREKDGYRTWFGGVEIRKTYVSAHLIPVYVHPDLLNDTGDALRQRMQGKSCFNFRKPDAALFAQFAALLARGAARFVSDGRLLPAALRSDAAHDAKIGGAEPAPPNPPPF